MAGNLDLPKQTLEILDKLGSRGYDAYVYGKCARTLLKGRSLLDFDIIANAGLDRIRAIFDGYKVIEDNLDKGELIVTVLGVSAGIKPYADLREKLSESAFTVDAIAYSPEKGFKDPFGGLKHMEEGVAAFTPNSAKPENILPALAWYSEEDYTVAPETKEAIFGLVPDLAGVRPAFMRGDFERVVLGKKAGAVLDEYAEVFFALIPELEPVRDYEDFLPRAFKSVGSSAPLLPLRLSLLFCELGKPDCCSRDSDGGARYLGHVERARIYAERIMARFGYSREEIKEVGYIIENRDRVSDADDGDIKDLLKEHSVERLKALLLFKCAESRAKKSREAEHDALRYKRLAERL
ncbi:MAG: hypothetical protein LBI38_06065 [Oscillospiraceae bacterium]|nr:hypothetical protein [Oscillospiraceae bacterium]